MDGRAPSSWSGRTTRASPYRRRVLDGARGAGARRRDRDLPGRPGAAASRPTTAEGWTGFGRYLSDDDGRFRFVTVKPGSVERGRAPHIDVSVFARGLLQRLSPGATSPTKPRRTPPIPCWSRGRYAAATLVADLADDAYRFDIRLQGDEETAFFDW